MENNIKSTFKFNNYNITNVRFSINEDFEGENGVELDVSFKTSIKTSNNGKAIINLTAIVFENCVQNNYPFELEINIQGYFSFDNNLNDEDVLKRCKVNGTSILFPYLRSAITDVTKIANVNPLVLPSINIYNLIKENEKE
ncbi:protein-export chaperone SecB [Intestinibacter bartlettii]|uniref:protein-export chaperone SecB n=1 Tax=Intestinibacter bartlettii TaxID=261299 RepID=UPI00319D8995